MFIDSAKYTCAAGHDINEDSHLCNTDKGIFIVADGLGGHSDGEKASFTAIEYFEKNSLGGYTDQKITELMEGANTEVISNGDGGKTTVAAAFMENGNFIYANAGDSRVYYFRNGKIIAQTKDHSVCQASVDMGMIRPEDIRGNEDRSRLLKVLGSEEKLNIKKHYQPIRMQQGDAFLICSDGFWEYVFETEMEADLLKSESAEVWLKHMLKRHILRAENKGDNYTAICGMISIDENEFSDTEPVLSPEDGKSADEATGNDNGDSSTFITVVLVCALLILAAVMAAVLILGQTEDDIPAETEPTVSESTTTESTTQTTDDTSPDITTSTDVSTEDDGAPTDGDTVENTEANTENEADSGTDAENEPDNEVIHNEDQDIQDDENADIQNEENIDVPNPENIDGD